MQSATLKKEERKTLSSQEENIEQDNSDEEDIFKSIKNLDAAADNLIEQKTHLTALLNQLETKAEEEVEKRKRKVEKLNSEVLDLKRKCEKYATWVSHEPAPGA